MAAQPSVCTVSICDLHRDSHARGVVNANHRSSVHGQNSLLTSCQGRRELQGQARSLQSSHPGAEATRHSPLQAAGKEPGRSRSAPEHGLPRVFHRKLTTLTLPQGSKNCIPNEFWIGNSGLIWPPPIMTLDKLRALLINDGSAGKTTVEDLVNHI